MLTVLVHIVIHATPQSRLLTLNCYVRGDDQDRVFEVEIGENKSIASLKKAIKDEKSQTFRDVDVDSLVLWKGSVSFDRRLKQEVEKINFREEKPLQPGDVLSRVFSDGVDREVVHIVVDPPHPGE